MSLSDWVNELTNRREGEDFNWREQQQNHHISHYEDHWNFEKKRCKRCRLSYKVRWDLRDGKDILFRVNTQVSSRKSSRQKREGKGGNKLRDWITMKSVKRHWRGWWTEMWQFTTLYSFHAHSQLSFSVCTLSFRSLSHWLDSCRKEIVTHGRDDDGSWDGKGRRGRWRHVDEKRWERERDNNVCSIPPHSHPCRNHTSN